MSLFLCICNLAIGQSKNFVLVIDAGHGGKDAGALGAFSKEKDINLNVSLAFGQLVESNLSDVRVIYTRKTDVFIPLKERAEIANKNKANLFISIHTNALPAGRQAYGMETYTLGMHRAGDNFDVAKRENSVILIEKDYKQSYQGFNPNSSESYIMFEFMQDKNMSNSVDLAKMIQKETCTYASRLNKGVHQAGFLVLRETSMPSCLVELGFITTPEEERMLNDKSKIALIAEGMYNAFVAYKSKYYGGVSVPLRPKENELMKIENIVPEDITKENVENNKATIGKTSVLKINNDVVKKSDNADSIVFKVQVLVSPIVLKKDDIKFKGITNLEYYVQDRMYKYTCGASSNYREIVEIRKNILSQFPDAFVVAFKNGERMVLADALREYNLNNKNSIKR